MVRFLSLEPLLGPRPGLNLEGTGGVIVGGESGPGARPMGPAWVLRIRGQCLDARVPFFFKPCGRTRKKKAGSEELCAFPHYSAALSAGRTASPPHFPKRASGGDKGNKLTAQRDSGERAAE